MTEWAFSSEIKTHPNEAREEKKRFSLQINSAQKRLECHTDELYAHCSVDYFEAVLIENRGDFKYRTFRQEVNLLKASNARISSVSLSFASKQWRDSQESREKRKTKLHWMQADAIKA